MASNVSITDLLLKGGVYANIPAKTAQEAYRFISQTINLPSDITADAFYAALCEREKVLTTAVGNGVALPHSQKPILQNPEEECVAVCYLQNPIDMGAADGRLVHVMFVLLTSSLNSHLQAISQLARYLQKAEFRRALEQRASISELITLMHTLK